MRLTNDDWQTIFEAAERLQQEIEVGEWDDETAEDIVVLSIGYATVGEVTGDGHFAVWSSELGTIDEDDWPEVELLDE